MQREGTGHFKMSNDPTGNRTQSRYI